MPTVEIVSIDCRAMPKLPTFVSFDLRVDAEPRPHRALFRRVYARLRGVMVHLGNKGADPDGFWFASDVIDWRGEEVQLPTVRADAPLPQWWGEDQAMLFRFNEGAASEVRELMERMIAVSPVKQVVFATDYQFGPSRSAIHRPGGVEEFFRRHDEVGLRWNTMYRLGARARGKLQRPR